MSQLNAGAVSVELNGNDEGFRKAIEKCERSLESLNKASAKYTGFTGFAARYRDAMITLSTTQNVVQTMVIAPLKSAMNSFVKFGSQYAIMAKQTGASTRELSAIGYAAEQSGTSIDAVGAGMKKFQTTLAAASVGEKGATQALAKLGLRFGDLKRMSKADQFRAVAEGISQMGDETLQAEAAMKIFGGTGHQLLPLLQKGADGIREMMEEADGLGVTISDEDAQKADKLSSAIGRIRAVLKGARTAFIANFTEPLIKALEKGQKFVQWISSFVAKNRDLITVVAKVSAAIVGLGGALLLIQRSQTILTPLINLLFSAFRIGAGIISSLGPVLMGLLSPFGAVAIAIGGVVAAILYFTGAGSKLLGWIGGFCTKLKDWFTDTFGDVFALIVDGRITDAVKLLWLQIQVAFQNGLLYVTNLFNEYVAAWTEPFNAVYGFVKENFGGMWTWICETAKTVTEYFYGVWQQAMKWLGELFGPWWTYILGGWESLQNDLGTTIVGGWWMIASGINDAIAWIRTKWNDLITGIQKLWLNAGKMIAKSIGWIISKITGLNPDDVMGDIERQYDIKIQSVQDRADAKKDSINASRQGWQNYLDDMAQSSLNRVNKTKLEAPETNDKIDELNAKIGELRDTIKKDEPEAKPEIEDAAKAAVRDAKAMESGTREKGSKFGTTGTFSAFNVGDLNNAVEEKQLEQLQVIARGVTRMNENERGLVYG